jgi:hypothetical protein
MFAVDRKALFAQHDRHASAAVEGRLGILLVKSAHHLLVEGVVTVVGVVVEAGAGQLQQLALPLNAQRRVLGLDELPALVNRAERTFF